MASGLLLTGTLIASSFTGWAAAPKGNAAGVEVKEDQAQKRVEITIDGTPFTSFLWGTAQKKPILDPIIAADGLELTRGYPLTPHTGERTDHPHHAGMWFNYGNVNGFDFWNNSDAIKPEDRHKMGTVGDVKILSAKGGPDRGELVYESTWTTGEGTPTLKEHTRLFFSHHGAERVIDRVTTLQALDLVVFHDDKEGLLGMRVARWLESPNEKGGMFTDADGRTTKVEGASGAGATGVYLTSEGKKGDEAWATRGKWCTLTGTKDGKTVAIAIFDHIGNPGYPTYWHARGYGLFAANPLGQHIFDPKAAALDYTLEKGSSATFRYRVSIYPHAVTPDEMNRASAAFDTEYR